MHYLKCTQCEFLNEVNSEYQVFCSKCGKKMENNYTTWKQYNSDASFEEYKQKVCITEADLKTLKNIATKKRQPRGAKFWVGFIISMIAISLASKHGADLAKKHFIHGKIPSKVLTEDWEQNTYPQYGLTVHTPYILTKIKFNLPEHVKALIESNETYQYATANGAFYIMVNLTSYIPDVGEGSLEGAADGSINEIKFMDGISDLEYEQEFIEKNGVPGFVQHVFCNMNNEPVEYINCGFMNELMLIQVMIGYHKVDDVGREAARRIFDSVEIVPTNALQ